MNDNDRAALVEELAEGLYVFDELSIDGADMNRWSDADPALKDAYRSRAHHKVMPIIDRLLTTRREPAADAVERAAKAMFAHERDATGAAVQWGDLLENYGRNGVAGKAVYRDLARAALAAAGPSVDEMLDSVHPKCVISVHGFNDAGDHIIYIRWPDKSGVFNATGDHEAAGIGSTRTEAIANAVAAAKRGAER